ncbi:outer membrane protein assembly factor BamA [Myxococcota bacterium]|nr:outer membrane protein assembly factor BamA [Myxococcota bacterium]
MLRLLTASLAALLVQAGLAARVYGQSDGQPETQTSTAADVTPSEGGELLDAIDFTGLKRVEAAAIRVLLTSRKGRAFRPDAVAEDIRAIYGMGYFRDVKAYLDRSGGQLRLVFEVTEKPAVARVEIRGNDDVGTDDIKDVVDIRPFTILNEAKIKRNVEKIKDLYNEKGFYLAEITSSIEPISENQVVIAFDVVENAKVEVRKIRFVGNQHIADDVLKSGLATQEGNLLSFLTGAGTYRKDAFQVDILRITSHYFDNGYINVKVDTPDIEISPDRKYIYITIRIEEGEQYSIGKLGFSGDLIDPLEKLEKLVQTREAEIFNRTKLGQDLLALKTRYEDDGFAYANITPVTAINTEKRLIDITFDVQKGDKVYYERINVVGNTKTRDKVIRRELRIYEGDLTSATLRELSRRRVNALGYFEKVDVKTRKGSRDDLQIVDIEIKEKATGTFQIGAGFSSAENFIATAQISQDNFLGRGQSVALSAQLSSLRQLFQLRFTEPYFLDTDWTLSFDAFNTQTAFRSFNRASSGGDLTLGHPITDDIRFFGTYTLEFVKSSVDEGTGQVAYAPLNNSGRISSLRGTVAYDTRDNRLFPSAGHYHSLSAEFSSPWLGASENRAFEKYRVVSRYYYPILWDIVGKVSARAGYIHSSGSQDLSPSEKFIMGGINSIRGYSPFSIGPESLATSAAGGVNGYDPASPSFTFLAGGNKELLFNLELEFPIFEAVGIKGVLFADAGNVYGEEENFFYADGKVRAPRIEDPTDPLYFDPKSLPLGMFWSVGFGFRWFSPIGPLRFEWGIPLTPRPDDDRGPLFEFSIGNAF